jgi:hypothetical protein
MAKCDVKVVCLIPIEYYTIAITMEAIGSLNCWKVASIAGIERMHNNLRRIKDITTGQVYIMQPFGMEFPSTAPGYKKWCPFELKTELEDLKWEHNNLEEEPDTPQGFVASFTGMFKKSTDNIG